MEVESRMLAGSIGKTFVAATAIAPAAKARSASTIVSPTGLATEDWYPRLPNGSTITLRHLLTHSSGLLDHVYLDTVPRRDGPHSRRRHSVARRRASWSSSCSTPSRCFPVGEGYAYTDTGYILIGMVLERAVGKPYYEQVRERFLDRFELARTRPSDRPGLPGLAAGYLETKNRFGLPSRVAGDDGSMRYNPATEWTGGGLYSNPQDLVRWAKLLYEGRAIDGDYVDELLALRLSRRRRHRRLRPRRLPVPDRRSAPPTVTAAGSPATTRRCATSRPSVSRIAIQINRSYDNDLPAIVDRWPRYWPPSSSAAEATAQRSHRPVAAAGGLVKSPFHS